MMGSKMQLETVILLIAIVTVLSSLMDGFQLWIDNAQITVCGWLLKVVRKCQCSDV